MPRHTVDMGNAPHEMPTKSTKRSKHQQSQNKQTVRNL